jgi:putative NADPH-quinone reductase
MLVLVYPTWWGGPPAILKGWLDRVWIEGVAYALPAGTDRVQPRLRNLRRLVVVTTHGSPKRINVIEGEPGKHLVGRQLRALCHPLARTRWIAMYGMDTADDAGRREFLTRVERRLSRWRP